MLSIFTRIKPLLLFLILYCSLCWQGCNIINPHEQTPTYIHIDSFSFQQNPAVTTLKIDGSPNTTLPTLSHQVGSAWVYYNGSRVGLFDLPVTFPVIAMGNGQLQVAPAIAIDGQNINVAAYPFYAPDTSTLAAQPGKVINYEPKTKFYSGVTVKTIDYFEGRTEFALSAGNRPMEYKARATDDSLVYEGLGAGEVRLLAVGDSSVDSTKDQFTIPTGLAFIEFTYKSTIPFYVGLKASLSSTVSSAPYYLSGISPSPGWQKFYLQVDGFTGMAQGTSTGVKYNFYIKAVLADGQTSGRLLIDNIHLVSF